MSGPFFEARAPRGRFGLKGPGGADWLARQGIVPPATANTWAFGASSGGEDRLLIARLGSAEFFLEDAAGGTMLRELEPAADTHPAGVYPVLRQDAAFLLRGAGTADVLAQVCNLNFPDLVLDAQPIVMTMMIGVSVLVVPWDEGAERQYRIWCDPTFGRYMEETLGQIVTECGGSYRGAAE